MSNARIIEIPATRQIRSGKNNTMRKMRVAAYCRVSTEEEEQQGSFETQKLYYTEKINSTSEWELAGIYADDGISGIHTKKRDGFNQMIQDCKKKKIDLILTKSISRFARNTLDSIQYVRMLKAIGIAVIFEKENINTSTMNSEMILTPEKILLGSSVGYSLKSPKLFVASLYQPWSGQVTLSTSV